MKPIVLIILLFLIGIVPYGQSLASEDPWHSMQDLFPPEPETVSVNTDKGIESEDPWRTLQDYFIPFTEQQEVEALTNHTRAVEIAGKLHERLYPFRAYIALASERFQVPPEIIGAVIMVESSGNPQAKATTSSAKGLMQTIDSTFAMGLAALKKKGITLVDSPFNVHSSIMTGSWYLGRMYDQAVSDGRLSRDGRTILSHWRLPAEYYYAGPGHGKKKHDVVITYAGGKRIVINKPAYSQKVLRWATIMATK